MVSRIGDSPSVPPENQPPDSVLRLSKALKSNIAIFSEEIKGFIQTPHLADSAEAMQALAQSIDNLHNLSNQAAAINVK